MNDAGVRRQPMGWLRRRGAVIQIAGCLLILLAGVPSSWADLQIDPDHPYYFLDDGHHVCLLGLSQRETFYVWRSAKGFHWREHLETLRDYGFNYVRQDVTAWGSLRAPIEYPGQFSNPAWPFVRGGPGTAVDDRPRFDLTRINNEYFDSRIRPFLRYARKLGIYVELTLFDCPGRPGWDQCLYHDRNNVNELGIRPRFACSDRALNHDKLRGIQEHYVSEVLALTSDFGNVIYEICNECGGREWVTHFVNYIHDHPEHPSHLVSAGEQASAFDPVAGPNDIVVKHRGRGKGGGRYATDADAYAHHKALIGYRAGKPVTHNEFFLYVHGSTDDPNFVRKMMWGDFTAGGHCNYYDFAHFRGTGRKVGEGEPAQPPPREMLIGGKHLRYVIDRVPFWEMEPADDTVHVEGDDTYAMAFVAPGRCYLVYLLGASVDGVTLVVAPGRYQRRWYDPKTGEARPLEALRWRGGEMTVAVPDFDADFVLWLSSEKPQG